MLASTVFKQLAKVDDVLTRALDTGYARECDTEHGNLPGTGDAFQHSAGLPTKPLV